MCVHHILTWRVGVLFVPGGATRYEYVIVSLEVWLCHFLHEGTSWCGCVTAD